MSKRILLLSFFYPPDLSAGSFRARTLVDALQEQRGDGIEVDVLTTQPNRYHSHATDTHALENMNGVRIRRVQLPMHSGGILGQARAFVSFARQATRFAGESRYDLVVATSSRLMTAVLGGWMAYRHGARLYLDIRDIFVENLREIFPAPVSFPLSALFGLLERWAICRADRVNLVSASFLGYFQPRYPGRHFSLYSNGVDSAFHDFPPSPARSVEAATPLQALYAGNIGDGQGLHLIVPELAERLRGKVVFRIVGGGGRLDALREAVSVRNLDNVELVEAVPRVELLGMYSDADILFLHLNDFKAFRRVLPSKLFEYAATGKPIWAGVAGHAAAFISVELTNVAVFPPCDARQAMLGFERLELGSVDRSAFVERYARARIMQAMALDVLDLLEPA